MIASFSYLSGTELTNLSPDLTVFLFSLGGLEQHGPHLPIGTKAFTAESFTQELAKSLQSKMPSWNFVIMPLLPVTVDTVTSKISITVRAHVVRDLLVDQCHSLRRLGFQNFAVSSAHVTPRQLSAIEDAGKILSKKKWLFFGQKSTFISVNSAQVRSTDVWKSPMIAIPNEHGGAIDTGTILKLNPKLITGDLHALADQPAPQPGMKHTLEYFKHEVEGYWGKPREATAENADFYLSKQIEEVVNKLQLVLEQNVGQGFFQSGYRYFPMNGSFFKAYLLAVIFFILMLAFLMFNLREAFNG